MLAALTGLSEFSRRGGGERPPAPRAVLEAGTGPVWGLAFSPDGGTLAMALDNGTVKLWDVPSGEVRLTLEAHKGAVWAVAFSPDGQTLATASSDSTIRLWDPATGDR